MKKILFLAVFIIPAVFLACGGPHDSEDETYTVTFDPNGGSGGPASATAAYGEPMPAVGGQAPARSGYTFEGYYDAPGGGVKYYAADLSSARDWDKKAGAKLYARWTPIPVGPNLGPYDYAAPFAETAPVIDGNGNDPVWASAEWKPIDQVWLYPNNANTGTPPAAGDFTGRYKIVWTADRLYYLVEITDDVISVTRQSTPLQNYYEDDCLELFIDEDASGGNHERSYNAWAYHMSFSLEPGPKNVVDIGTDGQPRLFNDHLNYMITQNGTTYTWEVEMKVFADTYNQNVTTNTPVPLHDGKVMGFAVAYNDADSSNRREHFMGSVFIEGTNKNVAWQNASVFAKLYLVK